MTTFGTTPGDSFERIFDTIKLWVQHATGIDDVSWHRDPEMMVSPVTQCRIKLTMMSTDYVGSDEVRRAFDSNTQLQSVALVGLRLVTVQMVAESFTRGISAHTILERVRLRVQGARLSHTKELHDENISVNLMGPTTHLPTEYDTMVVSVASSDMLFNVAAVVADSPEDWVESIDITGDLTD